MRALLLTLTLVLASAPLASANMPPVAAASAPSEAVLFEPVTFTDASHDPDGTIVSAVWTFTDGRDVAGPVVTRAFDYPGVHTITLRVTDDDGASASTQIQVLVHATILHGRATALRAGDATLADTGDVSTASHVTRADAAGEVRYGQLRAAALDAELRTLDERAIARASVAYVYIPVPIGYILATGIESESLVRCDGSMRTAKFTQLRLNDAPLVPPGSVAPNTRVALPGGGVLELNVQDSPAPDRLGVAGLRLTTPGAPAIEVARAEAGVTHCPHR